MVGAMAAITLGSIVLFSARHVWLYCTGGLNAAVSGDTRQPGQISVPTSRRPSVPLGASLCDRLMFRGFPHHHIAEQRAGLLGNKPQGAVRPDRDLRLLI